MARYDKYDPISGGFRAPLAANLTPNANGEFGPKAISLDDSGGVEVGTGGTSGLAGLLVKNAPKLPWGPLDGSSPGYNSAAPIGLMAGDIVDVMTNGEIVEVPGIAAGQKVYATAAGDLTTTATGNTPVGWTVQAGRLVVRVSA